MIEIDLLPAELRKSKKPAFEMKWMYNKRLPILVLAGIAALHLFLQSISAINARRLNILKKNWQGMSGQKGQIDQLNSKLTRINKEIPLIEKLIKNRVLISQKLNRISDLIISGVWLHEITLKEEKVKAGPGARQYLVIKGSAASRTQDEPALIGRFMQNLKNDSSFSADFAEIELGPIKKRKIRQTEIMDFVLICRFKNEQAKTLLK
jgi:Tfp pilus assembly protein PilN